MGQPTGMIPLRVYIISQNDPIYLPHFFDEFLRVLPQKRIKILSVDLCPALNRRRNPLKFLQRVLRFWGILGTIQIAAEQVSQMLSTSLSPSNSSRSLSRLCRDRDIPLRLVKDVNDSVYINQLKAINPDILLSVSASQIFQPALLKTARRDAINIHSGRLPRYRGMMPVFWQVLNQETDVVISVHTMTSKLDSGDLIYEHKVPVGQNGSLNDLIKRCKKESAGAVLHVLELYLADSVKASPLPASKADCFSFPSRKDVRQLKSQGWVIR